MDKKVESINERILLMKKRMRDYGVLEKLNRKNYSFIEDLKSLKEKVPRKEEDKKKVNGSTTTSINGVNTKNDVEKIQKVEKLEKEDKAEKTEKTGKEQVNEKKASKISILEGLCINNPNKKHENQNGIGKATDDRADQIYNFFEEKKGNSNGGNQSKLQSNPGSGSNLSGHTQTQGISKDKKSTTTANNSSDKGLNHKDKSPNHLSVLSAKTSTKVNTISTANLLEENKIGLSDHTKHPDIKLQHHSNTSETVKDKSDIHISKDKSPIGKITDKESQVSTHEKNEKTDRANNTHINKMDVETVRNDSPKKQSKQISCTGGTSSNYKEQKNAAETPTEKYETKITNSKEKPKTDSYKMKSTNEHIFPSTKLHKNVIDDDDDEIEINNEKLIVSNPSLKEDTSKSSQKIRISFDTEPEVVIEPPQLENVPTKNPNITTDNLTLNIKKTLVIDNIVKEPGEIEDSKAILNGNHAENHEESIKSNDMVLELVKAIDDTNVLKKKDVNQLLLEKLVGSFSKLEAKFKVKNDLYKKLRNVMSYVESKSKEERITNISTIVLTQIISNLAEIFSTLDQILEKNNNSNSLEETALAEYFITIMEVIEEICKKATTEETNKEKETHGLGFLPLINIIENVFKLKLSFHNKYQQLKEEAISIESEITQKKATSETVKKVAKITNVVKILADYNSTCEVILDHSKKNKKQDKHKSEDLEHVIKKDPIKWEYRHMSKLITSYTIIV